MLSFIKDHYRFRFVYLSRSKILMIVIFLLFMRDLCYAQQKGYKEIQIGRNIVKLMSETKYHFGISNSTKSDYYAEIDTALICGMPVDHLKISVDDKNIITDVLLYTKMETLPDYNTFSSRLKKVLFTIKDNLGTPVYTNLGKGEMKLLTVWEFEDTKTMLSVRTDDVGTFTKDFKTAFLFIWQTDKSAGKVDKMW